LVNWLAWTTVASGFESIRTQEIFQCRSNEVMTWGDGRDRPAAGAPMKFAYNPAGAPAWFPEELASGMVATAAAAWSLCGVASQTVPWPRDPKRQKDLVLIQWQERESDGNFALANFKLRTLSLGPKAFELLKSRNPNYDSRETLQMVISHEMGHLFGLMAHSRRCVDVMSYYDNGKGESCYSRDPASLNSRIEYRNMLPTACDIERCRKANGKPPLPGGRLGAPALGGLQEAK
jgi:hypothetical protein